MVDPADALRKTMTISAILEHAPEPESDADVTEVVELKVPLQFRFTDVVECRGLAIAFL